MAKPERTFYGKFETILRPITAGSSQAMFLIWGDPGRSPQRPVMTGIRRSKKARQPKLSRFFFELTWQIPLPWSRG